MEDILGTQVAASAIIVWIIQKLKGAKWVPFITQDSGALNRIIAVLGAAATTAGIHFSFDTTGGVLTVTGVTLMNVGIFAWDILRSTIFQEIIYRSSVKPLQGKIQTDPLPEKPEI